MSWYKSPIIINKITPFVYLNDWLKSSDTASLELTNKNSIKERCGAGAVIFRALGVAKKISEKKRFLYLPWLNLMLKFYNLEIL